MTANSEKEKTKEQKNIYEKMAAVKTKLLGIKKGGKNDFSHYSYFELGDILPVLTPALQEERLYMQTIFSATEQIAKLVLVDIDNTADKIEFECRFAECALKGAHEIQNYGAAQTYTRRYLIMTAFDIAEADIVDAGEGEDKKTEKKIPPKQRAANPKPEQPKQPAPQTDLAGLKRETWSVIRKLPGEQQAEWVNKCKEADAETLKGIIRKVKEILDSQQPEEETEDHKKRVDELKDQIITLIEKLPTELQKDWFEATQNSNSIGELCDFHSQLKKVLEDYDQPPKPVNPQELEIY